MIDTSMSVLAAVDATLTAIKPEPCDSAAAKLAQKYAVALDEAKAIERAADKVLKRVLDAEDPPSSEELVDEVRALRNKLVARTALVALGQRLEAVLNDMHATPAARAKQAKAKPADPFGAVGPAVNPLHALRSRSS